MDGNAVNDMNDKILHAINVAHETETSNTNETTIYATNLEVPIEEKLNRLHAYLKEEFSEGCRGVQCFQCPFMTDHELLPVCNVLCKRVQTQHEEIWRKNMEKKSW